MIMITTEIIRPVVPGRVMSPNPVERSHCNEVNRGCRMEEVLPTLLADDQTGSNVREDGQPKQNIECLEEEVPRQKGCDDDEQDGRDVEEGQAIAEAIGFRGLTFVEVPNP